MVKDPQIADDGGTSKSSVLIETSSLCAGVVKGE